MSRYILSLDQGTTSSRAIVFDRRGDNRVRGIEVPMCQAVSHARDLGPRQVGLIGEEVGRKRLHGFPDLYQPYANGVEDQRIA